MVAEPQSAKTYFLGQAQTRILLDIYFRRCKYKEKPDQTVNNKRYKQLLANQLWSAHQQ